MRTNFDIRIDLHGMRYDEAELEIIRIIRASANRNKNVLIIHGRGHGILKNLIREMVQHAPEVKDVWHGEDYNLPGFDGVTAIFL